MVKALPDPHLFVERLRRRSERQAIDITYLIFGSPDSDARIVLGKGSDGTVFLPSLLHPAGADGALVKAGLDKIRVGEHQGQLYVPADWLRAEVARATSPATTVAIIDRMVAAVAGYRT